MVPSRFLLNPFARYSFPNRRILHDPITAATKKLFIKQTKACFCTTKNMSADFRLKGLKSIDLKVGEKREVEVEGIDETKVLLVNVGGKTTALGAKCTHYGAPLVKGVLTGEGRITCPWHGACFNASTGDIENAPALDALPCFPLSEKDGGVYIAGEAESIRASRRKPNVQCAEVSPDTVVIVGGGSGSIAALESLRENGFKGAITLISNEGYLPIDRTKLSKALIDDAGKIALRDEAWFKSASVDTITDTVTSIDFSRQKVATKSGSPYSYTKLILATGGNPRSLPLPGFQELGNIFVLRTVDHVKAITAAIEGKGKKIIVIGSSFIGMEVGNATAKDNAVTIVGMEEQPLERIMGAEVGKVFRRSLEGNGAKFYMGAGVEKASPSASDPSKVGAVHLKDGTVLEADVVILGTGVAPATEYLQGNSAVQLLPDGSLETDEHFAVHGLRDVYAIGDIATYPYHGPGGDGQPVRIEHWNVAQNSGRAAAAHITDASTAPTPFIPIFWSALGAQLRYCGSTVHGWDDLVLQGAADKGRFVAYYTKGETVVAVATMQADPVMAHASELMRRGKMPGKTELAAGLDLLEVSVPPRNLKM